MAGPYQRSTGEKSPGRALRSKRVALFTQIEDLLARGSQIRAVSSSAVAALCEEHGVDLARKFRSERRHLYLRYLAFCLEDRVLSEQENADLDHLRQLLQLSPEDVAGVHDEVAREVYGGALQEVLADLRIDPEEEAFLRRLRGELALHEDLATELTSKGTQEARDRARAAATVIDPVFQHAHPAAGDFTGRSSESYEAAVADALAKARAVVDALHWFEVTRVAGLLDASGAPEWHVTVRAGVDPKGLG